MLKMPGGSSGDSSLPLGSMSRRSWATFLWGDSRAVLNRVLYAMVRANDSSPFWLDIRGPADAPSEPGPVELGWIPPDRLFVTEEPAEARPQNAVGNLALATFVRSDEPPQVLTHLSDFLRLPPIAQEIVSRLERADACHVVAIANTDRVRRDYPTTVEEVRHVIEPFLAAPILPFMAATSPPGDGRWAFDFVIEVRAKDLTHWREGLLLVEKAPPDSGFVKGRRVPLPSVPDLARVLESSSKAP
jgi:hypothetical protein